MVSLIIELFKDLCDVIKHTFRLFRHARQHLAQWANNKTAAIEIFQTHTKRIGDTLYKG